MINKPFADVHVHIRNSGIEEVRKMLDDIASMGVTHTAIQALAYRTVADNLSALYHKQTYDKMEIRAFGGFHRTDRYAAVPFDVQYEHLMKLGFDGVKLLDNDPWMYLLGDYGTNHPSYDRAFSMMEERGTPFLLHSNDPRPFWDAPGGVYADPKFPSWDRIYTDTLEMLDKHPKLNIVLAHFFFVSDDIDKARTVMETYPNVKLDLTPGGEMYLNFSKDIDTWRDFFITYQDRILFGTDCAAIKREQINKGIIDFVRTALTHDRSEYVKECYVPLTVRGLELPEAVVDKITFGNYIKFVGEKPKKVNKELFCDDIEYVLRDMRENPEDKYYEHAMKHLTVCKFDEDPHQKAAKELLERILSERE